MHARIENQAIVEYPIVNLRQRLPDISLPVDLSNDAALPPGFVCIKDAPAPQVDPLTQRVAELLPTYNGSNWVRTYSVVALSPEEAAQAVAAKQAATAAARLQAYQNEADPVFFKWQRGEATRQEWMDKVAEVKARFP